LGPGLRGFPGKNTLVDFSSLSVTTKNVLKD
jgi:hypothetical protein